MMRRTVLIASPVLVAVAALTLLVILVAAPARPVSHAGLGGKTVGTSIKMQSVLPSSGVSVSTHSAAINQISALKAEVSSISRIEAKQTTWGTFVSAQDAMSPSGGSGFDSEPISSARVVWLVAVSGSITPPMSVTSQTLPWAVYVIDASTGTVIGMQGNPNQAWPSYFDAVADQSSS